jgi:hypothetical protein
MNLTTCKTILANGLVWRAGDIEIYQPKVNVGGGIFSARNVVACKPGKPSLLRVFTFSSTDGFQVKQTSVANKLAMTNMFRFVTITTVWCLL